jgi:hypothetical protein
VDLNNSMLVAMMFVMVLSIGIGNILMSLSSLVDRRTRAAVHWIPTTWLVLLLLQHFGMFWNTLAILEAKEWDFAGFLYIVSGPMILFLATAVMLPGPPDAESENPNAHYLGVARQFYSLLALLMLWTIGADFSLGGGFTSASAWNVALLALFIGLGGTRRQRVHAVVTGLAAALMASAFGARLLGLIE